MDVLKDCGWLVLKAANGLDIPYVGYLELDLKIHVLIEQCEVSLKQALEIC